MKHRKLIALFTAALLGISAAAFPPFDAAPSALVAEAASEQTFISGNYEYSYVPGAGTATFVRYNGSGTSPKPASYIQTPDGQKKVTKIGSYAFHTASEHGWAAKPITSVTIPSTVTEICEDAFRYCSSLKTVSFSSKLKKIRPRAFQGTKLTEVVLPETVSLIGNSAFLDCKSLKTATIQKKATIEESAFQDCTALTDITLPSDCILEKYIFSGCTSLKRINGITPWTTINGVPVITSDPFIKELLGSFFSQCEGVEFVDKLCTAICDYVVKTETTTNSSEDWMGDAVKARQLHDWLIRHCMYEDEENGETLDDPENNTYSGVFLSYMLNVRGTGIGETVCEGYAKAYAMLLRAAGIESYVVDADAAEAGKKGHAWNIVKISGKYYQCDTCWDADKYWKQSTHELYGTVYKRFLKNNAQMQNLHGSGFKKPYIRVVYDSHPYLTYTRAAAENALSKCNYTFDDSNMDGLLNMNWDFDNKANSSADKATYLSVCHSLGYEWGDVPASGMQCFLYNLFYEFKMSPAYFRSIYP